MYEGSSTDVLRRYVVRTRPLSRPRSPHACRDIARGAVRAPAGASSSWHSLLLCAARRTPAVQQARLLQHCSLPSTAADVVPPNRRVALALAPLALVSFAGSPSFAAVTAPDRAKYEYMPALEHSDFGKVRHVVQSAALALSRVHTACVCTLTPFPCSCLPGVLQPRITYPDFTLTPSGLQYKARA